MLNLDLSRTKWREDGENCAMGHFCHLYGTCDLNCTCDLYRTSSSTEANSSSNNERIPAYFIQPEVHYRADSSPPPVPVFSQKNWVFRIFTECLLRRHTDKCLGTQLPDARNHLKSSMGRDTAAGIATRYGLDGPGIESRLGGYTFRTNPDRPWGPPSLLYNGYRVFPGGKAAGAWRWPLTPSSARVKESYTSTLPGPSWSVLESTLPLHLPPRHPSKWGFRSRGWGCAHPGRLPCVRWRLKSEGPEHGTRLALSHLSPIILTWLLHSWKICAPLLPLLSSDTR